MTAPTTVTLPQTAAAQSALAQQVRTLAPDYGMQEAMGKVAQELNARRGGGDIFADLAFVGAACRAHALFIDRAPSHGEFAEAQLSMGS